MNGPLGKPKISLEIAQDLSTTLAQTWSQMLNQISSNTSKEIPRGMSCASYTNKPRLDEVMQMEFRRGSTKVHWRTDHGEGIMQSGEFLKKDLIRDALAAQLVSSPNSTRLYILGSSFYPPNSTPFNSTPPYFDRNPWSLAKSNQGGGQVYTNSVIIAFKFSFILDSIVQIS